MTPAFDIFKYDEIKMGLHIGGTLKEIELHNRHFKNLIVKE